jgi:DNA-binding winged helix-turn-helix (wHTH) protein
MKYLLGFIAALFIISALAFSNTFGGDDFNLAKQELLFRKIGHEVLLQAGDSTSRVLPIQKIATNNYSIRFEKEFSFHPDSLVNIITQALANSNFSEDYVVNVLNCDGTTVQFGYAIAGSQKNDIIACSGRLQPKSCYLINIKFENSILNSKEKNYLFSGLPVLACVGLLIFSAVKSNRFKIIQKGIKNPIQLGNTVFDSYGKQLLIDEVSVELTAKETKILMMLAQPPNTVVERTRLQKEIWEDEGVIVGRSLDMFISKLRKKLEKDPTVQLLNIHGKGYKLVINSNLYPS